MNANGRPAASIGITRPRVLATGAESEDAMTTHLQILTNAEPEAPRTYGDCLREGWGDHDATGPCPWVRCTHHLAWGRAIGRRKEAGRAVDHLEEVVEHELEDMPATCALRVAAQEPTLKAIGDALDVTRARIGQIEAKALAALSYTRADVLAPHRDEGHDVSRPDLAPDDGFVRISRGTPDGDALARAVARVVPGAARDRAEGQRRNGVAPDAIPARVYSGPPVRVLVGAEKAQRIAELKARGGAPVTVDTNSTEEKEAMARPKYSSSEAAKRALSAFEQYVQRRGISQFAAMKEVGVSSSSVARLKNGEACTELIAERLEAAVAGLGNASAPPAVAKAPRKAPTRKPAARKLPAQAASVPAASLASELARVAAVIADLGGLDRAERIAAALREDGA